MNLTGLGLKLLLAAALSLFVAACASPEAEAPDADATAAPAVEPEPVVEAPSDPREEQSLSVYAGDRVFFALDSSELNDEARETLRRQADWMSFNNSVAFVIEGHCDERGTRDYNLALGERRANAVKNYLVALGVEARRLNTVSYGKERPVDPRATEEAWAKNRRGVTTLAAPGV